MPSAYIKKIKNNFFDFHQNDRINVSKFQTTYLFFLFEIQKTDDKPLIYSKYKQSIQFITSSYRVFHKFFTLPYFCTQLKK